MTKQAARRAWQASRKLAARVSACVLLFALGVPAVFLYAQGSLAWQRAEAAWKRGDYASANDYFRAAVAAEPRNADYKVRWGKLFYERF